MKIREVLKNIDVSSIMHPDDISTIKTLNKIPGFKSFVDKTVGNIMEKYATIEYSAEGINVTNKSIPKLHHKLREACRILNIEKIPELSTDWQYHIASYSVGDKSKRMVLLSGTIDLLNEEELNFILGHELGHMVSGHKTYHMLTEALYYPISGTEMKIWINLIKMPLLNWYRSSDFTADRFGLLCCQDIKIALSTMVKMAGLPKKMYNDIDVDSFIRQAETFKKDHNGVVDNAIKYLSINAACMPWLVLRASELLSWYNSGEYDKIINSYKSNK